MPEITSSKYLVVAGWDDAPHLGEKEKAEMLEATPPHLRDARSKGIPSLGSGAIYPIEESEITCDPFEIPSHWPVAYGMDVGWKRSAAIWGALDRESDILYLWSEHYRGEAEPSTHAHAIRSRADWIPGVIDTSARGRSQVDGRDLMDMYRNLGLIINPANKSIETGLQEVWMRMATGRLKIFKNLQNTLAEYRIYRRDEKGRIVKDNDHLMDSLRYLVMSMIEICTTMPYSGEYNSSRSTQTDDTGF